MSGAEEQAAEGALAPARPRIVLTGPTGWIGTAMLAHLAARCGPDWRLDDVRLFASSAREHRAPDGKPVTLRPLAAITPEDVDGAVVIHLAYLTRERAGQLGERAFTDGNLAIDDALLGAISSARPKGVFVASSGAAQLAERGLDRHPYGIGKLRQEDRFLSWGAKAGLPVLAGRIFNLAGPYMNKIHAYALSSFLWQARNAGRISIDAQTPVFRSFLHVEDLCRLAFDAIEQGEGRGRPVDLCGADILEMGDIAEAVAAHVGSDVQIVRRPVDVRNPSVYLGDPVETKVLAMSLGVKLLAFRQQLIDTDRSMTGLGD